MGRIHTPKTYSKMHDILNNFKRQYYLEKNLIKIQINKSYLYYIDQQPYLETSILFPEEEFKIKSPRPDNVLPKLHKDSKVKKWPRGSIRNVRLNRARGYSNQQKL